jgi:DNA mismatch repair protein MutS2
MHALRVLEFSKVLARIQRHAESELGAAVVEGLAPSFVVEEAARRLAMTKEAHECIANASPPSLVGLRDLRRSLDQAAKGATLAGETLWYVGHALTGMREMKAFLTGRAERVPILAGEAQSLPIEQRLEDALHASLESSGEVKDGASTTLADLRQRQRNTVQRIQERIQSTTTGPLREFLSDPIYTVREGRYVVPVKSEYRSRVKGVVHDASASGATVYIEPEEVLQLGNTLRELAGREREEIGKILAALSKRVGEVGGQISVGLDSGARIDAALAIAKYAFEIGGVFPEVLSGPVLEIQKGKHPLLDAEKVVPLDFAVGREVQGVLITGPNTGGKTVALKVVGLFVAMLQTGIPVPALHVRAGHFSGLWADIGDEQSIQQSLSTFSGHIKNISEALREIKKGSLVLFDELGAGTDPAEGAALAKAILLELQDQGAITVSSSHYGELKAFAFTQAGFQNAAMEFDLKSLRPTYRLLMGASGASQALRIAERFGIPPRVISRAKEGLSDQHVDLALLMEELDRSQKRARQAQSEADRRTEELRKLEERARKKLLEAEEIRDKAASRAGKELEETLRELRLQAQELFDELKRNPARSTEIRRELEQVQLKGSQKKRALGPKERPVAATTSVQLEPGAKVKMDGYSHAGVVLEAPKAGRVKVQFGLMKMEVKVSSLTLSHEVPMAAPRPNLQLQKVSTATTEISLRGMRFEDAQLELEKFIDDSVLAGLESVRIVHGKGEGILRKMVSDMLRRHPHVSSFAEAQPADGGAGVTIARLG